MNSARGTRTVRLQRKASGFDFSVKGGREHGIPVVVSWVKQNGAAASSLNLGDEILAVNGQPLNGLTHKEAVARLKGAGLTLILRVRPNQALGDVFSSEIEKNSTDSGIEYSPKPHPPSLPTEQEVIVEEESVVSRPPTTPPCVTKAKGPLPPGWGEKVDLKTGRPYYENHYTQTSTWTDPRSLKPISVKTFEWNKLPSGWERHIDQHGDIYYVCHDTQLTHWDSPRGMRQQTQLTEVHSFIQEHKEKLRAEEKELKQKRELLLKKNQVLDSMSSQPQDNEHEHSVDKEGGEYPMADIIDDIMLLNEEVESQDGHVTTMRHRLHSLTEVLQEAHLEELGERDGHVSAARLALELIKTYSQLKRLETKLLEQLQSIGEQMNRDSLSTPLPYMLQLPPTQSKEDLEESQQWLHTLPDKLTGKTNCEMRVELCVVKESYKFAMIFQEKLAKFYERALQVTHGGWEQLIENLATLDFSLLDDQWLQSTQIREKLEKLLMF